MNTVHRACALGRKKYSSTCSAIDSSWGKNPFTNPQLNAQHTSWSIKNAASTGLTPSSPAFPAKRSMSRARRSLRLRIRSSLSEAKERIHSSKGPEPHWFKLRRFRGRLGLFHGNRLRQVLEKAFLASSSFWPVKVAFRHPCPPDAAPKSIKS